ncbi:hypothetical protein EV702DRAFT_1133478 [Suillus placidus]|uniref:Uncharacterized protein n=1 Tax=Suillus placidus TaxID=48579 RepID=A0A9P6ZNK3_9AGAM|nr:hypothetical protein EV702DRAFT_1133478 [Suillus placidus]
MSWNEWVDSIALVNSLTSSWSFLVPFLGLMSPPLQACEEPLFTGRITKSITLSRPSILSSSRVRTGGCKA